MKSSSIQTCMHPIVNANHFFYANLAEREIHRLAFRHLYKALLSHLFPPKSLFKNFRNETFKPNVLGSKDFQAIASAAHDRKKKGKLIHLSITHS